jgi:hypothetical protein
MFTDIAAGCDIPMMEAVELEEGTVMCLRLPMPEPDQAIGGTFEGWVVGVSGTAERDGYEVVVVREEGEGGPSMGFGGVLRSVEGGAMAVVSPVLVLHDGDDRICLVGEVNPEDAEEVARLLVRAAAGTLLAWTPRDEGGMLH